MKLFEIEKPVMPPESIGYFEQDPKSSGNKAQQTNGITSYFFLVT